MRPPKISEAELLARLSQVMRSKGYDGASLKELATACGLQKASLYHRFPGGKQEIATAVMTTVGEWADAHVLGVLRDQRRPVLERLDLALANIDTLYDSGKVMCVIRALSMDNGIVPFGAELKGAVSQWVASFQDLGQELGMKEAVARKNAIKVMSMIQGSLVLSRTLEDTQPFQQALQEIRTLYENA